MKILSANFLKSCPNQSCFPQTKQPEYAFIGRSNVGKSSLINYLSDRKNLAKTSGTPGRTRLANFFEINEEWLIVDLPGYGYAKADKKTKEEIQKVINAYLKKREELVCLFVLIDSRLEPQKSDMNFLEQCGLNGIPLAIVFTKADKLGKNQLAKNIATFKKGMKRNWESLPEMFISSSTSRKGGEEILNYISSLNKEVNSDS